MAKKETDPQALLEHKREQGRNRVKRFRERVQERADAKIAQALTKLTSPHSSVPIPMDNVADRTARALLKRSAELNGVNVDACMQPIGEALRAQRVRKIGKKTALQPDFQSRLRASEQGFGILERIGEVPSLRHAEAASAITVNVLVMSDKAETDE